MMGWKDDNLVLVDFVVAAYMTPFLPGGGRERTWAILVGPGAAGKTELLSMVMDYDPEREGPKRTVFEDDFTENALVSGYRDDNNPDFDPSVFARLDQRRPPIGPKVLVLPEMGPVWGMPRDSRARWFHRMRRAFDGHYVASSGKGGTTYYKLKFGFLGASTEKVDDVLKQDQPLGTRMMLCRLNPGGSNIPERQVRVQSAARGDPYEKQDRRNALRTTFNRESEAIIRRLMTGGKFSVGHPLVLQEKMESLANIVTLTRTVPVSDQIYTSSPEEGARFVLQLETWGDALATFDERTTWIEDDYVLMRRIATDTLPPDLLRALCILWGGSRKEAEKAKSGERLRVQGMMGDSSHRQFEQWVLSGLLWEPDNGSYAFTSDALDVIERCDLFGGLDYARLGGYSKTDGIRPKN